MSGQEPPEGHRAEEITAAVDERLAERLEAARKRREWLETERRRRKKKRDAGLRMRHAAKLRRNRGTD